MDLDLYQVSQAKLQLECANKNFSALTESQGAAQMKAMAEKTAKSEQERSARIKDIQAKIPAEDIQNKLSAYQQDYATAKSQVLNFVPDRINALNKKSPQDTPEVQAEQLALKSFIKDPFIKEITPKDSDFKGLSEKMIKILSNPVQRGD